MEERGCGGRAVDGEGLESKQRQQTAAAPKSVTEAPQGEVWLMDRWHKGPACCLVTGDKEVTQ